MLFNHYHRKQKQKPFQNPLAVSVSFSHFSIHAAAMANSQIDRLSNLHDALLLTILSFLPTRIAARTSALSHHFRHLWEASPSIALISRDLPHSSSQNFAIAKRVLLHRNPSHPLLSLRLELSRRNRKTSFLSSLLAKACSLDLRHLTIEGFNYSTLLPILPIIFSINSLRCLSLGRLSANVDFQYYNFPSGNTLTCLRSLSLRFVRIGPAKLNQLISQFCSLEDLHLDISGTTGLSLSSQTIKKLKLIINFNFQKLDNVVLSLPSLESLYLETYRGLQSMSPIHVEVPLLRKARINLLDLDERDVSAVARLLNCISHVEELSLHIKGSNKLENPIPILLESGKDVPNFSNLKHLDVTLCFHEHNLEVVTTMLHNCPVLESLKLVDEIPKFTGSKRARGRKKKDWESKLPLNEDGNYRYAYFENLYLEENRKEVIKLLSKHCSSKRQAK